MSPRPFRLRRINNPPMISGMKPYGVRIRDKASDTVFLLLEEYEAVRLCDHEMLNHFQASSMMNVSRPTLTRIYARARKKVAEAIVMGKQIIIEGGKIYFDSEWFECQECGCYFNNPEKPNHIGSCPLCSSENIKDFIHDPAEEDESHSRCSDLCICPVCKQEKPHHFGHPCKDEICPECGFRMVRKRIIT